MTSFSIILSAIGLLVAATTAQAEPGYGVAGARSNPGNSTGQSNARPRGNQQKPSANSGWYVGAQPQSQRNIRCPAGYSSNEYGGCSWGGWRPASWE